MEDNKWEIIKRCSKIERTEKIPVALLDDSDWIPGYTGISTLDYYTIPEKWFNAQMQIRKDFPELISIPDLWVEFGMATEPSGFGCKFMFYKDNAPNIKPIINSADDIKLVDSIKSPNPKTDGLMPIVLNLYKNVCEKISSSGESIKIVAARGPFTIASFIMGITEFLIALKVYPEATRKLLSLTTNLSKNWLYAQLEILKEAEGIMILDDVVGFLSKEDYLEFGHNYLKEIFSSFPEFVKLYHNDNTNTVSFEFLEDLGVNILNFTYTQDISKIKSLCGDKVCLMGNVPPVEVLGSGTPDLVKEEALKCLRVFKDNRGIILSAGGGVVPGTPKDNILALFEAIKSEKQ